MIATYSKWGLAARRRKLSYDLRLSGGGGEIGGLVRRRSGRLAVLALLIVFAGQDGTHAQQILERVVPERRAEAEQKRGQKDAERFDDKVVAMPAVEPVAEALRHANEVIDHDV